MGSGQQHSISQLFDKLVDLETAERQEFLDHQFAADDELRDELERLLEAKSESTPNILDSRFPMAFASTLTTGAAAPRNVPLPAIGDRIGKYTILRKLDDGGMGVVYLARDGKLGRRVALKWLLSTDRGLVSRFKAEARTTARCRHENIVVIHEVEEHENHPYIVFEYIEGRTLRQWMRDQDRPLPRDQVLDIIIPVVRALACAHELDTVHRDLKPENIMITASGAVKVLDFGIAKILPDAYITTAITELPEEELTQTRKGAILGTLPYMSPEQWRADSVDHRTDLWAVGLILHELVTGRHPLAPFDEVKLRRVADLDVPMPRLINVKSDMIGLAKIINDCLEKRKELRISTTDLLGRLERSRDIKSYSPAVELADAPLHEALTTLLLSAEALAPLPAGSDHDACSRFRSRLEGYRILCVDDEPLNCELMRRALGRGNYIETTGDTYKALELLQRQTFDVMLTDLQMPGRSGTELAIKARAENPELIVVLLTGYDDDPKVIESLKSAESPVIDVVAKPCKQLELVGRILDACDTAFRAVVRRAWPDYLATQPVLLDCRRILRRFVHRYGTDDILQTALRHKMKDCVHAYARGVVVGEPGASAAEALRVSLLRIEGLMERVQISRAQGLLGYLESISRDFADDYPQIYLSMDIPSPFSILDDLSDIQLLLTLSAIELIDNARDALDSQGKIRVQLRKRAATRAVSLKVWCDSSAIRPEIAERIFEEGVSSKGPGRGMGLAIVKAMVRRFRGGIQLQQHDGVSFLVTIPLP
jgi:serine/threonine protein kinase/CheY-like chemotaxis protein